MRRATTTFAVLAGLVLAMAAVAPGVLAQDEMTTGDHPVLGSWIVDPTPTIEDDAPELITFHVEGAIRGAGPNGPSVGAWEPTGERTADALGIYFGTDPATGSFLGLATVRVSLEVSEDGQTFHGTYTFEPPAVFAEAMGIPVGELGPSEVTGQRIRVEPMGEPVGPIPDFAQPQAPEEPPAEPQGEGTPPTEETMSPVEATAPPDGESPAPIEETPAPVDETAPPVEGTMPPVAATAPPLDESPAPVEQESPAA